MVRIFVALPIPDNVSYFLLQIGERNSALSNIRWTPRDNLHITLFFIGEVLEGDIDEIRKRLEKTLKSQEPFTLEFESIVLKGRKHPSMIWAAFRKKEIFTRLSENIYQSVKDLMTIKRSHEDPIPHCTLARMKAGVDIDAIDKDFISIEESIKVNHAELWQTIQSKDGVTYKSLNRYDFS